MTIFWGIKLKCGHSKKTMMDVSIPDREYFCVMCCAPQTQDVTVPAERVQIEMVGKGK